MITFLEGILVEKQPTRIVLNVGGVGYEVFIPLSSYDKLGALRAPCHVHTFDHVREDAHTLYGFATTDERRMFELLLSISGIGPKLALAALSGMGVRDIKAAVVEGDASRLNSISGVGRKTAERIVVELKDKIGKGEALEAVAGEATVSADDEKVRDAVLALVSLGYKQDAAHKIVRRVMSTSAGTDTVEEIVRQSLMG
jgi:Holliday junction DNA helicase RuvA